MKTTALLALVAAATLGYAAEAGEEHYVAPPDYANSGNSYDPDSYDPSPPAYGGGGGGGSWGHGWGGSGHRGGRFGGKPWGHGGGGGGSYYGSCSSCQKPPRGYAIPPPDVYWPVDPSDYPPGPFRDHFDDIGNKCSSVNNVGNGPHAAGCCNKAGTSDGGDDNGGGGLLGGLLNGVLGGGATCTLDILSSICSSGSVACCPVEDSGNGFSLINVQGVCAPITL